MLAGVIRDQMVSHAPVYAGRVMSTLRASPVGLMGDDLEVLNVGHGCCDELPRLGGPVLCRPVACGPEP